MKTKTHILKFMLAGLAVLAIVLGVATMTTAVADDKGFSYSLSFDGVTYSYGKSEGKHGTRKWYGVTPHFHSHHHFSPHRFSHPPYKRYEYRHAPSQTRYYYRDGSRITYYDTDDGYDYGYVYEYDEGEYSTHSDEVVYYYDYEADVGGEVYYYYGDGAVLDATRDIGTGLIDATTGLATDVIDGVGYLLFGD